MESIFFSLFFVTFISGCGSTQKSAGTGEILYRLNLKPADSAMYVSAEFPPSDEEDINLILGDAPEGNPKLAPVISDVEAVVAGASVPVRKVSGARWSFKSNGKAYVFKYKVSSAKKTLGGSSENELYQPAIFNDTAFIFGWTYLLYPVSLATIVAPINLKIAADRYQNLTTNWGGGEARFKNFEEIKKSVILAGNFRLYQREVGHTHVQFALADQNWKFSDQQFVDRVESVIAAQTRYMGSNPYDRILVTLFQGTGQGAVGTAGFNSISMHPPASYDLVSEDAPKSLIRIIAHENFHLWNGHRAACEPSLPEGHCKWFHEGFTDYFAYWTLAKEKTISLDSYIAAINFRYHEYQSNPVAFTATISEMEKIDIYANPNYDRLNYRKGLLLALLMDIEIRKLTQNKSSLLDLMKMAVDRYSGPEFYNIAKLQSLVESLTHKKWNSFFTKYVRAATAVPIAQYFSAHKNEKGELEIDPRAAKNRKIISSLIEAEK